LGFLVCCGGVGWWLVCCLVLGVVCGGVVVGGVVMGLGVFWVFEGFLCGLWWWVVLVLVYYGEGVWGWWVFCGWGMFGFGEWEGWFCRVLVVFFWFLFGVWMWVWLGF
jgi:hypothetical protein